MSMSKEKKLGRFQVMALLQAARYYLLTGDKRRAYSFGLNRAIFYAWAKRRGGAPRVKRRRITKLVEEVREKNGRIIAYVGDEAAFVSPNGWFIIGGEEQKPEDFEKEIVRRIESVMPFEEAWKQAVEYLESFDKRVLLSQREFFEKVYKPVRDAFPEGIEEPKKREKQETLF